MREMGMSSTNVITEEQRKYWPPVAAAILGLFVLFVAGLAQPDILHNAAHDSRHAVSFPCH